MGEDLEMDGQQVTDSADEFLDFVRGEMHDAPKLRWCRAAIYGQLMEVLFFIAEDTGYDFTSALELEGDERPPLPRSMMRVAWMMLNIEDQKGAGA